MKTVSGAENTATQRSRHILRAGFIAATALIGCISVFAILALHQTRNALNDIVQTDQMAMEKQFEMFQLARERSIELFSLVNTQDPFEQDAHLMRFYELGQEFVEARRKLLAVEKGIELSERALLDQQLKQTQDTVAKLGKVIEAVNEGRREESVHLLVEEAIPAQDAMLGTLNSLMTHEILETHFHVDELRLLHEHLIRLLAFSGGVAVLLVGFIAGHVRRRTDGLTEEISASAHELEQANKQLEQQKLAMDQHDIVSISDIHGNIIYVNDKFCEVSQYGRDELIGQNHRILKSSAHPQKFYKEMWETISNSRVWHGEVCNRKKDGSLYWISTTIVPFLDSSGLPYQYVSVRTEITDIKEAQQILMRSRDEMEGLVLARTIELAEREDMLSSITNSAQDAVVMISSEAEITYWNPAAEKIFGYSAAEIMGGDPCAMLVPKRYCGLLKTAFSEFQKTGTGNLIGKTTELSAMRKSGAEFPVEVSMSAVRARDGWHAVGIARDISARKLAEQRLEQLATTDPLTGTCNRRHFNEVLHVELSRSQRYRVPLTMVMFDIDHFKRINDTYGHLVGDKVLVQLTNLISENIRETDIFARMGGEEFAILAPNCDMECAMRFAEKLRRLVEALPFTEAERITCSFGVAEFHDGDEEGSLIQRADKALYQAKHAGRNMVVAVEAPSKS